jgi:hypothetical protein
MLYFLFRMLNFNQHPEFFFSKKMDAEYYKFLFNNRHTNKICYILYLRFIGITAKYSREFCRFEILYLNGTNRLKIL